MKVEEDGGFDEFLCKTISVARKDKVPIVFCMTKFQLGTIWLKVGQNASIVGILDVHGAIPEFKELVDIIEEQRIQFYQDVSKYKDILHSNQFLESTRFIIS